MEIDLHHPGHICLYSGCVMSLGNVILSELVSCLISSFISLLRFYSHILLGEAEGVSLPSVIALRLSEVSSLMSGSQKSQDTWSRGPGVEWAGILTQSSCWCAELLQLLPLLPVNLLDNEALFVQHQKYKNKWQKTGKSWLNIPDQLTKGLDILFLNQSNPGSQSAYTSLKGKKLIYSHHQNDIPRELSLNRKKDKSMSSLLPDKIHSPRFTHPTKFNLV